MQKVLVMFPQPMNKGFDCSYIDLQVLPLARMTVAGGY
jgi:hypothetical protein